MDLRWDYLLAIIIVVSMTSAVISGKASAEHLITVIGIASALVTGTLALNVLQAQSQRLFDERFGKEQT